MAAQRRIMEQEQCPTLYAFVLVGMKYNGCTAKDAAEYNRLVLMADPDNAVDPKAIKVLGYNGADETIRMLGHISMDSQPSEKIEGRVPLHGRDGTIYQVYSSRPRGQAAVEVQVNLTNPQPLLVKK
jgi:hypothetical protein